MEEMLGKSNIRKHMKNYYEILEVDKNASDEIIEKSYKILAKRYHPDLQNTKNLKAKSFNQEKMKQINEAYAVLSNDFKRREYDKKIEETTITVEEYNKVIQENNVLRNELQRARGRYSMPAENNLNSTEFVQRYFGVLKKKDSGSVQIENSKQKSTKKFKFTPKQIKTIVITLLSVILLIWILSIIPASREFFGELYRNNAVVKFIFDTLRDTFTM